MDSTIRESYYKTDFKDASPVSQSDYKVTNKTKSNVSFGDDSDNHWISESKSSLRAFPIASVASFKPDTVRNRFNVLDMPDGELSNNLSTNKADFRQFDRSPKTTQADTEFVKDLKATHFRVRLS